MFRLTVKNGEDVSTVWLQVYRDKSCTCSIYLSCQLSFFFFKVSLLIWNPIVRHSKKMDEFRVFIVVSILFKVQERPPT
jgi:hypothetical protein